MQTFVLYTVDLEPSTRTPCNGRGRDSFLVRLVICSKFRSSKSPGSYPAIVNGLNPIGEADLGQIYVVLEPISFLGKVTNKTSTDIKRNTPGPVKPGYPIELRVAQCVPGGIRALV